MLAVTAGAETREWTLEKIGEYDAMDWSTRAKVTATVIDAYHDDTDPKHSFLVLEDSSGRGLLALEDTENTFDPLKIIGARIEASGNIHPYGSTKRRHTGSLLKCTYPQDIRIIVPPPDFFEVQELDLYARYDPASVAKLGQRRARGRVLAVWDGNKILMQIPQHNAIASSNSVIKAELISPPLPGIGKSIEITGLPETDLYNINFVRARWRECEPLALPMPRTQDIPAGNISFPVNGGRRYNNWANGSIVRLRGYVRAIEAYDNLVYIDDNGQLFTADFGSVHELLEQSEVGSIVELTGVVIMDIDSWRPNAAFPTIRGWRLVLRDENDLTVIARPSWWTPERARIFFLAICIVLLAAAVWIRLLQRLAEKRARELAKESSARTASELRTRERTRLATELHDSIAQYLTGAAMELRAAILSLTDRPEVTGQLAIAEKTIGSARDELRNCIWDLRNHALEEQNIDEAIRIILKPHLGDTELRLRFNVPREVFSETLMHSVLCIIRELSINAVRHGHATILRIAGSKDTMLRFSVRDNGCGFDPEAAPGMEEGHFGLEGIRERVSALSGTIEFSSTGEGTAVTVTMPL